MGRSGTTLLEKLLCNHKDLSVLSQPLPLVYIDLKKRFLETLGIKKYFVLNDSLNNEDYSQESFNLFLENFKYTQKDLNNVFDQMKNYSGQMTRFETPIFEKNPINLIDLLFEIHELCAYKKANYFGSKEILCEEYMPYLMDNNVKTIVIVRDPRDVLASANYPSKTKFLGNKKPSLFILRSWRKSIEFVKAYNGKGNFLFVKYEDLVLNTQTTLDTITSYLNISNFHLDVFSNGILDQNGNIWQSNSSRDQQSFNISNTSIGNYKDKLSNQEIDYTEAICYEEMIYLGYQPSIRRKDRTQIIENFMDKDVSSHAELSSDYSSDLKNIEFEISRYVN